MERSIPNRKKNRPHKWDSLRMFYCVKSKVRELYKAQNNQQIRNKATSRTKPLFFANGIEYSLLHSKDTREIQLI